MTVFVTEGNRCKDVIMRTRDSQPGRSETGNIRVDLVAGTHTSNKTTQSSKPTGYKEKFKYSLKFFQKLTEEIHDRIDDPDFKYRLSIYRKERCVSSEWSRTMHKISMRNLLRKKSRYLRKKSPRRFPVDSNVEVQENVEIPNQIKDTSFTPINGEVSDFLQEVEKYLASYSKENLHPQAGFENHNRFVNLNTTQQPYPDLCRMREKDIFDKLASTLRGVAKYANVQFEKEWLSELEDLVLLFVALRSTIDLPSASAVIALYLRRFYKSSIVEDVCNYIGDLFGSQSGMEGNVDEDEDFADKARKHLNNDKRDWVNMLRDVHNDWKRVKENGLFTYLSKLLGLVVCMKICDISNLPFSLDKFISFEQVIYWKHINTVDFIDAALSTVVFFVDKISACWNAKSLRPLLLNDDKAVELDQRYAELISMWELVKNGNLAKIRGISDHEFDRELELVASSIKELVDDFKGIEKKLMKEKFMRLVKMKSDYSTLKTGSGLRKAPFVLEFFGDSAQGKTTLQEQLLTALLASAGLPIDDDYRAMYNASEKFMSTWRTDKVALVIDDMANDKSAFVERSPTRVLIDVCNNQPFIANMADIAQKGQIFVEPAIVAITTNKKDLDAYVYSNCPYSIQRRAHVVVTVEAKKEFQLQDTDGRSLGIDSSKVRQISDGGAFDDIWNLTLERAVQPDKRDHVANYEIIRDRNGRKMEKLSFREVLNYLIEQFHEHLSNQESVLASRRDRKVISVCPHMGCHQIKGYCLAHDNFSPHFGEEVLATSKKAYDIVCNRIKSDFFGIDAVAEGAASYLLLRAANKFAKHWSWLSVLPSSWVANKNFQNFMLMSSRQQLIRSYVKRTTIYWCSSMGLSACVGRKVGIHAGFFTFGLTLPVLVSRQWNMVETVKSSFVRELLDKNTVHTSVQEVRDQHAGKVLKASAFIAFVYAVSKVYRMWKEENVPQSALEPKDEEELFNRNASRCDYGRVVKQPIPIQYCAKNTTPQQLLQLVQRNTYYCTFLMEKGRYMSNVLMLKSNRMVVPRHYFEANTMDVELRHPSIATCRRLKLSLSTSYNIPETDLLVCNVSLGSVKDLTKYLPLHDLESLDFNMSYRLKDGEDKFLTYTGYGVRRWTGHTSKNFWGIVYSGLSGDTFDGLCGAVLTSRTHAIIGGFHLGGRANTPKGCAGVMTLKQFEEADKAINEIPGTLTTAEFTEFSPQFGGIKFMTGENLHWKSPLRYLPINNLVVWMGSCTGMSTFVSRAQMTPISSHVERLMGQPNIYRPPYEKPQYRAWQETLESLSTPGGDIDPELVTVSVQDYLKDVLPLFSSDLFVTTRPLTDIQNWNGIPGVQFIDRIKLDTSIGYPRSGKKSKYVVEVEPTGDYAVVVEPIDEIKEDIARTLEMLKLGKRANCIAKACKKDEIHTKDKCRVFYSNPIVLTFLIRKYYLPIIRVLQLNPLKSETAVGVNAYGPEWDELYRFITAHGTDRIIGGDYSKYDQKIPSQLLLAAFRILIDCASMCNYKDDDLFVMSQIASEVVYAYIAFNGDMVQILAGGHISGNPLTVIINSICGSLNLRCYFFSENPQRGIEQKNFRDNVNLITYGDDNIGSVHPDCSNFTIKGASSFLAKHGQNYTMPDKSSEILDFLPEEQFSFLKRSNVYHPELGCNIGALADESIFKSLHYVVREKNSPISMDQACGINISNACREWFNHGPEIYEKRRLELIEVAKLSHISHYCEDLHLDYDARVNKWKENYDPHSGLESFKNGVVHANKAHPVLSMGYQVKVEEATHVLITDEHFSFSEFLSVRNACMLQISSSQDTRIFVRDCIPVNSNTCASLTGFAQDYKQSVTKVFNNNKQDFMFSPQSGLEKPELVESGKREQNVKFEDTPQMTQAWKKPHMEATRKTQDDPEVDLQSFFARPIKIASYNWAVGSNLDVTFNPWTLFFTNPRVSNRMSNFNLMRSNLHLSILINGNPFHFGRVLASYLPMHGYDTMSLTDGSVYKDAYLTQGTQRPHIFLDPCKSAGGEMLLPFFYFRNYVNITDGGWDTLGLMTLSSMGILKHAAGGTDNVTISVFAWAEDISVSIPTSLNAQGLTAQMGKEIDEANEKNGVISGPATSIANVARALSAVPPIAPYAKATEKLASGISSMAKAYGYSRPPMTAEPNIMQPTPVGSLALTTVPDQLQKLSVDDKQELTIDPRISGIDEEDPLAISTIAQKETYLTSFDLTTSDSPESLLWNCRVHPLLGSLTITPTTSVALTAVAAATIPFKYWTGCLKFRFQFVTSAYHKGRIKVVYDPNYLDINPEYNVNYLEIVDLSEKNDFSVSVHNSQEVTWLETNSRTATTTSFNEYSTVRFNSFSLGSNGVLGVYVVNELTTPGTAPEASTVRCNVFVSAGEDYEVSVPNDSMKQWTFFPQMGFEPQSGVEEGETQGNGPSAESNLEEQNAASLIGICDTIEDKTPLVYMGETVRSFRTLLKRYSMHSILSVIGGNTGHNTWYGRRNLYPYHRGVAPNAVDTIAVPAGPYNLCNNLLFHWITMGHSGYRGGMRYKIVGDGVAVGYNAIVSRDPDTTYDNGSLSAWSSLPEARFDCMNIAGVGWNSYVPVCQDGGALTVNAQNSALSFEVPFYSAYRFVPGKTPDLTSSDGAWADGWRYSITGRRRSTTDTPITYCFTAVAEDFQCYFWTGLPLCYNATAVTL